MKHALISTNGTVIDVVDDASLILPVAPGLRWVEAPDGVERDWQEEDGVFTPPPPDPEPALEPGPSRLDVLEAALKAKGLVSDLDLEAERERLKKR